MNPKITSWDPIWETIFRNQKWGSYPSENLIQFISRNFYPKERGNVSLLEIGCGPGANIWFFAREGFNAVGVDGSETAIKQAKERLSNEKLHAKFLTCDIIKLPFGESEFDGVIDNECLYCNNEQNTLLILSEISRVLKKDGLFYSRTFSTEMFIGEQLYSDKFEYSNISNGPFSGKGLVRLINKQKIYSLYSEFFNIQSIDKLEYTQYNGSQKISEFIIICQKK